MIVKELHVMPGCVTYLCLRLVIKVEPEKRNNLCFCGGDRLWKLPWQSLHFSAELIDGAQFQSKANFRLVGD